MSRMKNLPCLAAEAARILGVTPATVRLMESRGDLPAKRTESGVRIFDRADVLRLAAERDAARDAAGKVRRIA
jgi:DNA-binding transcriptional MerR regulator